MHTLNKRNKVTDYIWGPDATSGARLLIPNEDRAVAGRQRRLAIKGTAHLAQSKYKTPNCSC